LNAYLQVRFFGLDFSSLRLDKIQQGIQVAVARLEMLVQIANPPFAYSSKLLIRWSSDSSVAMCGSHLAFISPVFASRASYFAAEISDL